MVVLVLLLAIAPTKTLLAYTCPDDMTELDCRALQYGWTEWAPDNGDTCNGSGQGLVTTLSGGDRPEQVWNFFKSQGLDDTHAAAVMGNMQQESGFDPTIIQNGGNSNNPKDAGPSGWGLSQWTPGAKALDVAERYNIKTPIYELVTQLNITWEEMNDIAPTGQRAFIKDFIKIADLQQATLFYANKYEGAGVIGPRYQFAQQALQRYAGQSGSVGVSSICKGNQGFSSAQCSTAQGRQKILCEAMKYDPVSYKLDASAGHQGGAEWHNTCPSINPSCYLDCSGLVNLAVYDAFGVDLRENTTSERTSKYWKKTTLSELKAGDIFQPNNGHVEIVDHVEGTRIYSFGAHTANRAQPGQVGPTVFSAGSGFLYLTYIGPGV